MFLTDWDSAMLQAEKNNVVAMFYLTKLLCIYLGHQLIAPAVYLCINRYRQATVHHTPRIELYLKLPVMLHNQAGDTLTHSVLLILRSLVPPCFYCTDHHHQVAAWVVDLGVGRFNPGIYGAALTSRCSGYSSFLRWLSRPPLDPMSPGEFSSLSFGVSKSLYQCRQFSVSERLSGALCSSHRAG